MGEIDDLLNLFPAKKRGAPFKEECRNGHPFTPENTLWAFDEQRKRHKRKCLICERARKAISNKNRPSRAKKPV